MTKQQVVNTAIGLLSIVGSHRLEDVLDYLDIKIRLTNNDSSYGVKINNKNYIYLSERIEEEIKPFTIAHEIGHIVLHDGDISIFGDSKKDNNKELEADLFAFTLLNKSIDNCYDLTIGQLASSLCVSDRVVEYLVK